MTVGLKSALCVSIVAVFTAVTFPRYAEAAQRIDGYRCMALNLTPAQMSNNAGNVPILGEPRHGAARVANATSVVLVKAPAHEVDDFVEVLRLNGRTGWVAKSNLKVWHSPNGSGEKCVPAIMSTGRYGFLTSK